VITALSIIAAIFAVSALIVLHEAGHMWAARWLGMRVERFSVGFGPVLWSTVRNGTEYAVSALPLGGYVKIAGMAASEAISPDDQTAYCNKPAWRRVLVLAAGPGANYLIAVLLAVGLLATVGLPAPDGSSRVGELTPGMPGAAAGLLIGDRIVSVDGKPVGDWYALVAELQRRPGQEVELLIERGEPPRRQPLRLTPKDDGGVGRVGFRPFTVSHQLGPVDAVLEGFSATNARVWDNLVGLAQVVKREQKAELAGPLGIGQELVRGARLGLDRFLTIVWNVSIALALLNFLPLPALDGGRLVFIAIEVVTRRRVNERIEGIVHGVGFAALLLMLVGVTIFGDIARMLRK
jgi:regulator of sigma E protease